MRFVNSILNIPGLARVRWVLAKEISSFFGSNLPPVTLGIVAFLCGIPSVVLALTTGATYEGITRLIFYMFYIIIIAASLFLSMSAFVYEKKHGTMELLYTLPISDVELTIGKFFMGLVFLVPVSIGMTLVYVVGIAEAPWYIALSGIYGLILVGFYAYSIGMFASSITESYLIALLIAVAIVFTIDIGGFLAGMLPSPVKEILTHLHGVNQYAPFTRGRIPLKGSIFFISSTVFFLFLTVKVLESRRWRT